MKSMRLLRTQVGAPVIRRVPGLRREEVATLASVKCGLLRPRLLTTVRFTCSGSTVARRGRNSVTSSRLSMLSGYGRPAASGRA
jgi:uncharacterized membrane protein